MADILVMDDDPNFVLLVKDVLELWGHKVSSAQNLNEFRIALANKLPGLIIMDMQFPGGGAPAAMKLLQDSRELSNIPVIFCSAMVQAHIKRWFPESPQRRYQKKPVEFESLKQQLQELLPKPDPSRPITLDAQQTALAAVIARETPRDARASDMNAAASRIADAMFADAVHLGASDIHLDPHGSAVFVRYRIDGILRNQACYSKEALPLIPRLRVMANMQPTAPANPMPEEGSFDIPMGSRPVRGRLSSYPSAHGDRLALRILDMGMGILGLNSLGFLPEELAKLQEVILRPNGIFLVSGGTGSGKTTTLCSVLKVLSQQNINIMTIEDPVEYLLNNVVHTQISPKVGLTFAEGLKSMLRQDPNVIMVGEVRDRETAEVAFQAAMTGHAIFSTIHASNAPGVVTRLLGMGIDPYMLSSFLNGTMAQRLVRRVCSECAQPENPKPEIIQSILRAADTQQAQAIQSLLSSPGGAFVSGKGCPACYMSGYRGRVGAFELLVLNDEIRGLILSKSGAAEITPAAIKSGMKTLLMDAAEKARCGWTTLEEVARTATRKN
ncbi:MAG: Flp pilus assembly complex ATPase component TadA [Elusimicrobia bacterium]|nr:Flp pilus assembly complex ATPase component TadA [Elusimicrobiota bacterium]